MTEHSINDANMTDANFTGAITTGFTGGGNIRSNTTCPRGTTSDNDEDTCSGHGFPWKALT